MVWVCVECIICVSFCSALNTANLFLEFYLRQEEYSITSTEYVALTTFKEK